MGHLDIIERTVKIFGGLTVLIAESSQKKCLFTSEERKILIEKSTGHLENVMVDVASGLTVDYMKRSGARVIIRGLRAVSDFEYELQMCLMNRKLNPEVETMIIMSGEKYYYIASNTVKEVAFHGGDISQLVPEPVVKAMKKKYHKEG